MPPLSAWDLLTVWERGFAETAVNQALLLLSVTWPDLSTNELATLTVGQRDGRLLALRQQLFGSQLDSLVNCPHCDERLEFSFNVADVQPIDPEPDRKELTASIEDYDLRFRLPNSLDLLALEPGLDDMPGQQRLLSRCLIEAKHKGDVQAVEQLPETVIEAIMVRMAEADPLADIQLNLVCPACKYEWPALFDINSFLWQEINAWAIRTLREVHQLASAYGWREIDILMMSPWRRQLYLQMVS